jgi:hypothetical protein
MHLHDLLGDGEPEAGASLGLSVGTVDLMELVKNARLMFHGNAWPRIRHADVEVAVDCLGGHAHLASVGELDGVAHEVEKHLGETLLVAEASGQRLGHLSLERKPFVLGKGLCGKWRKNGSRPALRTLNADAASHSDKRLLRRNSQILPDLPHGSGRRRDAWRFCSEQLVRASPAFSMVASSSSRSPLSPGTCGTYPRHNQCLSEEQGNRI